MQKTLSAFLGKPSKRPRASSDSGSGSDTEEDPDLKKRAKKLLKKYKADTAKSPKLGATSPAPPKLATLKKPAPIKVSSSSKKMQEITFQKHENYNEKLTEVLGQLETIEKNAGQPHKAKAYHKSIQSLKNHPTKITSGKEAQKLPGVGLKIGKKIDEILETGKLKKLEKLLADPRVAAINLLSKVPGVGPVTAKNFVDVKGLRTIDDLRAIMPELNVYQRIGVKYFEELQERIPRAEIARIEEVLRSTAKELDPKFELTIAGSYRRGADTSGDIDCLATHPQFKEKEKGGGVDQLTRFVTRLKEKGLLTDDILHGKVKYSGICQLKTPSKTYPHRHLDIRMFNPVSYPCALLYFTGSDFFNTQMRIIALEKGFTINEYEICPMGETKTKGDPIPVTSEQDIFDIIGMKYRTPEERNL